MLAKLMRLDKIKKKMPRLKVGARSSGSVYRYCRKGQLAPTGGSWVEFAGSGPFLGRDGSGLVSGTVTI